MFRCRRGGSLAVSNHPKPIHNRVGHAVNELSISARGSSFPTEVSVPAILASCGYYVVDRLTTIG